ncbi:MAG: hypothetical protein HYW89_02910 [Candidatus Sungiibacteriota bacterium]|uniref:Uncharacterized protein n=1 Tax=Candidatus Sungiibacteriota bacterium TaxID=2750080 RepID=A0A7T5UQC4_9BACT|nr:MAG: hypothetical protein HYW89_02910 [Candidatus Sungbacteria bacterium]
MPEHGTTQAEFEGLYIDLQSAVLRQLPRPAAFTRETLKSLLGKQAALRRGLAPLAKGLVDGFAAPLRPILQNDKRRQGWTLVDHTPRSIMAVSDLELVPFLRDGEKVLRGYDMMGRARYEFDADLGQEDAEFILERQAEIPEEFRQYYLVFLRTVWLASDGDLYVSCLYFGDGRWYPFFGWLDFDFRPGVRLARFRK